MSKKTHSKQLDKAAITDEGSQENVEKIRDILFGGHMRDYETRFKDIDSLIIREVSRLNKDMDARLNQLDKYVKEEFKLLGEKLQGERKDRNAGIEELNTTLGETRKAIEQRIADVDETHGAAEQEIRNRLHEQATELLSTITNNQEAIESSLRQETRKLGDDKVARKDMAGLLTEMALRLQREFDLPDDK